MPLFEICVTFFGVVNSGMAAMIHYCIVLPRGELTLKVNSACLESCATWSPQGDQFSHWAHLDLTLPHPHVTLCSHHLCSLSHIILFLLPIEPSFASDMSLRKPKSTISVVDKFYPQWSTHVAKFFKVSRPFMFQPVSHFSISPCSVSLWTHITTR
jgi:hypothetical protein